MVVMCGSNCLLNVCVYNYSSLSLIISLNSEPLVKILRTSDCYCDMVAYFLAIGIQSPLQGSGIIAGEPPTNTTHPPKEKVEPGEGIEYCLTGWFPKQRLQQLILGTGEMVQWV